MKKILVLLLLVLLTSCSNTNPTDEVNCEVTPNDPTCEIIDDNDDDDIIDDEMTIEERVVVLLNDMTLREKAGQMVQAERSSITPAEAKQSNIGSILSGGGSHPTAYDDDIDVWYNMYKDYQEAALESSSGIPLIYGIDAVHGNNNVYGSTIFPHNIGLGAANDPQLVYDIAQATAEEMLTTGINWTFAPALSVVQNIRWGRTYEGFSESPELYLHLTQMAILGFQDNGVSATAKHYLADGATINGVDQGNVMLDEATLRAIHLIPYIEAIEADVDTIMISYSSINGVKMHGHDYWINDVLKGELGFEGFIISDWNAIHQLEGNYYQQIVTSINAGVDMLMEPYTWKDAIEVIVAAVNNGDITEERMNDAVARILTIKHKRGLIDDPLARLDQSYLYNEEHKTLARKAVQQSLVLLKNNDNALPLAKNETVYITGTASDNIGHMSGGWTTYWQGTTSPDIGVGTSILDAFTDVLTSNGGRVTNNMSEASTVVVVLSELPYTEGVGDNGSLTLTSGNADPFNAAALQKAKEAQAAGKNVVGILISGRPLLLENYLQDFDAFIAAWLPGSEGGLGIADNVFGDAAFTGRLPYTWPRTFSQVGITINKEDYEQYDVLFPFGYGLSID